MTKTTTNLVGILITILAGIYFFVTYCSECRVSNEESTVVEDNTPPPEVPMASSFPFAFSDGAYSFSTNDNFNFQMSSSRILMPVSPKVEDGIISIKTFLDENSGKVLDITGYYKSDEINNSAFPDLGQARANAVKNFLVSKGIPSARLNTLGLLKDDIVPKDSTYLGPLAYELGSVSEDAAEDLKQIYKRIKEDPLILNFGTAQTSINLSKEQRQKFSDISRYLDKVEGASCSVIGHTDNQGDRQTNISLGQERADFAKAYLVQNGIDGNKIQASSKGPDVPVASNETEEGRAQNRRTVVTLN